MTVDEMIQSQYESGDSVGVISECFEMTQQEVRTILIKLGY